MKVILLKDVEHLGRAGDIKEVSAGYARNFLLPRNLAKVANPTAVLEAEKVRIERQKQHEEMIEKYRQEAEKMKGLVLELKLKTGKKGEVFKGLGSAEIVSILAEKGFSVSEDNIEFKNVKKAGDYEAVVRLGEGISVKLKVLISKQKTTPDRE